MKHIHLSLTKHILLALLIGLCGMSIPLYESYTTQKQSPHCAHCDVVIISLDTVRASELPCYGYIRNTMPNLCRYADQNIRFSNAHAQSSWTFPNATSVMTGLYPSQHRMYDNVIDTLHPAIATLPKRFKQAGYKTIAIINSQEPNIPLPKELIQQFDTVISTKNLTPHDEIQAWIHTLSQFQKEQQPIFLYIYTTFVGYYRSIDVGTMRSFPLDPVFVPPTFVFEKLFTDRVRADAIELMRQSQTQATDAATQNHYQKLIEALSSSSVSVAKSAFDSLPQTQQTFLYQEETTKHFVLTNPTHIRYIQNLYDAKLNSLDTYLAPLFDLLNTSPHLERTIAIIYSDHGENLGDHGVWGHATEPYSSLTHVPLIMHIPGQSHATKPEITSLMDIFPTILSITQISNAYNIFETRRRPTIKNNIPISPRGFTIAELNSGNDISIKTYQWLLLSHRASDNTRTNHLYNLQTDPQEIHDVSSAHPNVVLSLHRLYEQATSNTD